MTILQGSISTKRSLLCNTAILLGAMACEPATAQNPSTRTYTSDTPNVLLIYTDDLGYGDLSSYGATGVHTPNIDRLAEQGRLFTDAHSASAVCSPARYGLLTGEYPLRKNFWGPIGITDDLAVDTERISLGTLFKRAGYETAFFGKWHLGFGRGPTDWNAPLKPGPRALGFDYFFGIPRVNSGPPFVYVENEHIYGHDPNDPLVRGVSSITKRYPEKGGYDAMGGAEEAHRRYVDDQIGTELTERAVSWMQMRDGEHPFFLLFSTTHIHHPFTPAPRFIGTSEIGLYGDFIHELDWMVGELLSQLERINAAEQTIVMFTSDNQLPNMLGQDDEPVRMEMPISPNSPRHLTIRHGDWVYIPDQGEGGFQGQQPGSHTFGGYPALVFSGRTHSDLNDEGTLRENAPPAQLYNLREDPYQTTNLHAEYPEVVRALEARVALYRTLIPPEPRIGWIDLTQ